MLSTLQIRDLTAEAAKEFPHLEEHAKFLADREGRMRWGGMVAELLQGAK